ncbi:MAG: gamma-polyglutamate biosynthesis protein CapC [Kosmotogales bacterium]|nr:gamma-polyglutamate biosynthesis protein CapC [Kosmotogales bacterium]
MITISVGLSLLVSFIFSELTSLLTGGLISGGYLAIYVNEPGRIVMTLVAAIVTYFTIKLLSNFIILFGRRRFILSILIGFIFGWLVSLIYTSTLNFSLDLDLRVIGFIIPGLIANDMYKQGIFKTIICLSIVTLLVKFFLILIYGVI